MVSCSYISREFFFIAKVTETCKKFNGYIFINASCNVLCLTSCENKYYVALKIFFPVDWLEIKYKYSMLILPSCRDNRMVVVVLLLFFLTSFSLFYLFIHFFKEDIGPLRRHFLNGN